MNRVHAPRWLRALLRGWRMYRLQVRIAQLQALQARPDLWTLPDDVHHRLVAARMAELRCALYTLEMQR